MQRAVVVALHPVWSGIPVILTIVGWAQLAKALIYFIFPSFGLRRLEFVNEERVWGFRAAGAVLAGLGALLAYDLGVSS